jgi:ribosome-binding ATPase
MQIGIIGLPTSGKTTIFNALTRGTAQTAAYSSGKLDVHTAMVDVPDPRVAILSKMFNPKKTIHARVQYNDIAGLTKGIGGKDGMDGNLLNQIMVNDAIVHVIRAFDDPNVPHPLESVDPARDLEILDTELLLSDLGVVERRLGRIETGLSKGGSTLAEREALAKEKDLLTKFRAALENGRPLRDLDLGSETHTLSLALATLKPTLVVFNTGEHGESDPSKITNYSHKKSMIVALRGKLEMELAQMSQEDAQIFLHEFGIAEPGLSKMIRLSYALLGQQSFFTVGEDEVRAWTVRIGADAVDAAGTIHTDLARGFIRAEVIAYEDLIASGNMAEARKRGVLRLEGKEYSVKDGDILNIRFNVS